MFLVCSWGLFSLENIILQVWKLYFSSYQCYDSLALLLTLGISDSVGSTLSVSVPPSGDLRSTGMHTSILNQPLKQSDVQQMTSYH